MFYVHVGVLMLRCHSNVENVELPPFFLSEGRGVGVACPRLFIFNDCEKITSGDFKTNNNNNLKDILLQKAFK